MLKLLSTTGLLISLSLTMSAQSIIEKRITSSFFEQQEERLVKIWLPEVSEKDSITNVLYVFDADYCFDIALVNVRYLCMTGYLPPTAVVGVYYSKTGDRSDVGLKEQDMTLGKTGDAFVNYIENDVRAEVKSILKVHEFHNIFLGHSYLGDYGCYLLKKRPDLFDSYILIAPANAPFPYFKGNQWDHKRIFIAAAKDDTRDRQKLADKLYNAINSTTSVHKGKWLAEGLDHMTIIPAAIQKGLLYIYKDFANNLNIETAINRSETMAENYNRIYDNNKSNYKYGLQNSAGITLGLFDNSKKPTLNDLDRIVERVSTDANHNHNEIIGFLYLKLLDFDKAEYYLNRAVDLWIKDNAQRHMFNTYRGLLKLYEARGDSPEKSDIIYAEAIRNIPDAISWYYQRGMFNIGSRYEVEKGIQYLETYIEGYSESSIKYPLSDVYCGIAKGYTQLGETDKAMEWAEKALDSDKNHREAKQLRINLKTQE